MAAKKIIVASSKGGVGKTTVALGVAGALTSLGKTVLLCDLDLENRCLDLFMGIENASIFNIADVADGSVPASKAIIKNSSGLAFIGAPAGRNVGEGEGALSEEAVASALKEAVEAANCDFVIFDTGTAHGIPELLAKTFPDSSALVVASHQASSARGAEKTAMLLEAEGISDIRLVICSYEFKEAARNERTGLIDIIDSTRIKLIGIVPYDRELMLSHERGVKPPKDAAATIAFENIAKRICGRKVRLFNGIGAVNRKKII